MLVVANLLPLLPGEHTPVAFRFTALGGDWSIDDVYVDPYSRLAAQQPRSSSGGPVALPARQLPRAARALALLLLLHDVRR